MSRFAEIQNKLNNNPYACSTVNVDHIAWLIARLIKAEAWILQMDFIHSHRCANNIQIGTINPFHLYCCDVRHYWVFADWEAEAEKKLREGSCASVM